MRHPLLVLAVFALAGCAIHPPGEKEERARASEAGRPFEKAFLERDLPPLKPDASAAELLRHALLSNGDLEQRYWEWRAALERIPQEASPKTTLAISFETMIRGGMGSFLDRTTIGLGNDPMNNLPFPSKLATAGRKALEEARAAGLRFERARFELREKVLSAHADWALLAERIRLQEENVALLETTTAIAEGRTRAGTSLALYLLKAQTERDLAKNDLEKLKARVPADRAFLNALLGRAPDAPLDLPKVFPPSRPFPLSDAEVLALAAERNPELAAISREGKAREEAIRLAKQEYIPEFGLGAKGDLGGTTRSVMGMVTAPFLRWEALKAGVAEARAQLRENEAMSRQAGVDLSARVVLALRALRDDERQAALFRDAILPRAKLMEESARASYTAGKAPFVDLLDAQRMLIEIRTTLAEIRADREKRLAEIEAMAGVERVEAESAPSPSANEKPMAPEKSPK
ncbi:MAG: TolC family protein [Planctomycetota bacterium]